MRATGRYYWDGLTTTEQAALLSVQRADFDNVHLHLLNSLAGTGLVEWFKRGQSNQIYPVLTQRGASALACWRRAS